MLFKKMFALFCAMVLLCVSSGCSSANADARIYFELPDMPHTLDPQTASSITELLLVRNLYEGLLRENTSGEIVCGVAEEYTKKGLVYTFKLKKNATWYNGESLTADDFVFAFKRAVSPNTKSPFASRFYSIENAEAIHNGTLDVSKLSVKAADAHTLQITLCKEDSDFERKLTTAPFMPCNEKFFEECVGKYGLTKGYVLCNGSYYLRKWNTESFGMRLYKNAEYKGDFTAKNGALFISHKSKSRPITELIEKNVDAAILLSGELEEAQKHGLSTISTENVCWVLSFGGNLSADMKKAFRISMNPEYYASSLSDDFSVSTSFYPSCLSIDTTEDVSTVYVYDTITAKTLFNEAVKQTEEKRFPETTLYYFGEDYMKTAVTSVVGHWQKTLSAFINIKAVEDANSLLSQLEDNSLQMALFPITINSSSPYDYAQIFGKTFENDAQLQQELLKDYNLYPFAFQRTTVAYHSSLSNLHIDSQNGYIDFSQVTKSK